jgi:hypothetical protein
MTAEEILHRDFLDMRARILDLATAIDRIDRAASDSKDPGLTEGRIRLEQIHAALATLREDRPGRAERVQMIFSLPYDENWRRAV